LRFVRGETPVPVVVCRGMGEMAGKLLSEAAVMGMPVAVDAALTQTLVKHAPPGQFIPENTYQPAAAALSRAGLV
jgi:type III secretion protein U